MEIRLNLPKLAQHEYNIDRATGDLTLHIVDYAQPDVLKNFTVERTFHSRAGIWKFNIPDGIRNLTLKTLNRITLVHERDHLIAVKDSMGRTTRYEYEGKRLTRVTYPDGTKIAYSYDGNDQLMSCMAGGKTLFENEYDDLGRLTKVSDAAGVRIFFYDDQNRRTVENGNEVRVYVWNRRKQIEQIIYGDGSEERFAYDDAARLIVERDREGVERRCEYQGERLTAEIFSGGLEVNYEYDASGNLIRTIDNLGREEIYAYSSKNLLIEKRIRLNVKDWRRETFERDVAGRVLTHDINGRVTTYSYDEEAPVPSMMLSPCGYRFNYFYDEVYRLLRVQTMSAAVTEINLVELDGRRVRPETYDKTVRAAGDVLSVGSRSGIDFG